MEENLRIKDTITSLELLEIINKFREKENLPITTHSDLLIIIETELTGINRKTPANQRQKWRVCFGADTPEISKLLEDKGVIITTYIHEQNKQKYPMYILTLNLAKRCLLRESRIVREQVLEYIERLENRVKELESKPREMTPEEMLSRSLLYAHNLIQEKDKLLEQKEIELKEKDKIIVDKNTQIIFKDMKLRSQEHKVETYDTISEKNKTYSMNEVAKMIDYVNMGRNKLFEFLRQKKILMSNNLPFQKYVDAGWFKVITNTYNDIPITQTVVFLKGIEKICELLDKFGYKKKER